MYIIETARLGLRLWQDKDIPLFIKMNQDPKVMEFFPKMLSPEESMGMVERIKRHFTEHGFGLWAVEAKADQTFIGFIGLSVPPFAVPQYETAFRPHVEVGWRLASEYWGRGFAQEGARACLEYGFKQFELGEIISFTSALNLRSENVMKKVGMEFVKRFEHPNLESGHRLSSHLLYLKKRDGENMD